MDRSGNNISVKSSEGRSPEIEEASAFIWQGESSTGELIEHTISRLSINTPMSICLYLPFPPLKPFCFLSVSGCH